MEELLTKREIASLLKISLNTLNLWISRKKIPYLKLGKSINSPVRLWPKEIADWLKNTVIEKRKHKIQR